MPKRSDLRAVLVDIDGTLVDSNDAHASAWHKALLQHGHDVAKKAIRDWIGKGGDRLLPELTGVEDDSETGKDILALRKSIFRAQYLPKLRPFRRASEFVARLLDAGFLVAVATSAARSEAKSLLRIAGVDDLVHAATTADDADSSKPAPDILFAALEMLRVEPAHAVLVGDTPYDVEAALRAGMPAIGLESGGWEARELRGAIEVYRDVEDILDRWDETLFARALRGAVMPYRAQRAAR
jgi:HAD superfamily hydrolase (TIGR01509 family)